MSLKRTIERLGPCPSLFLLALPAATAEPLKLVAVAVAGKGHWVTGTVMIVVCYAFSLLVVERLFAIVKPKTSYAPMVRKTLDRIRFGAAARPAALHEHAWPASGSGSPSSAVLARTRGPKR
jgi:hypothetical protein